MSPARTITRTHNGGPDTIVHTAPDELLELADPPAPPHSWRDPSPLRAGRRQPIMNPWSVRALAVAVLLVTLAVLGVLSWR